MTVHAWGLEHAAMNILNEATTLHLHAGDPGTNGTANEVSTSGTRYSSVSLANGSWSVSGGTATLTAAQDFGNPGGNWGSVSHRSVRRTGGSQEPIISGVFSTPMTITSATTNVMVSGGSIAVTFNSS